MEKNISKKEKKINLSEMPADKEFEDFAEDTIFVLDETDDEKWIEEEQEEKDG